MLEAGVDILNISGAAKTADLVRTIRSKYPDLPIMATGGSTDESIQATLDAGANVISYTPPSNGDIFKKRMELYRQEEFDRHQ